MGMSPSLQSLLYLAYLPARVQSHANDANPGRNDLNISNSFIDAPASCGLARLGSARGGSSTHQHKGQRALFTVERAAASQSQGASWPLSRRRREAAAMGPRE